MRKWNAYHFTQHRSFYLGSRVSTIVFNSSILLLSFFNSANTGPEKEGSDSCKARLLLPCFTLERLR
jgi:hypothetical protein